MQKIVWTVLVTAASAAGATLAARAAGALWRVATDGPPPDLPWWSRWLVAKPVRAGVSGALHA